MEDEVGAGKVVAPEAESLMRDAETVNVYSRIGIGKDGPPKATCDKLSLNRATASDDAANWDSQDRPKASSGQKTDWLGAPALSTLFRASRR